MTDSPRLPEMPEPHGWLHDASGNDPLTFVRGALPEHYALLCSTMAVFTPDQVRALQIATWKAAMEYAAQQVPTSWLDSMLVGINEVPEGTAQIEWLCRKIAAAIRQSPDPLDSQVEGER